MPQVLAGLVIASALASANDIYIAQTAAGNTDGTSCANAHPVSFFYTSGNWGGGAGHINPGDTVHLCGTIVTEVSAAGSGTAGNVITIKFEDGAKLSQPAASKHMSFSGKHFFVIDGGTNGIIENTANGTGQSHVSTWGIDLPGATDIEIKNLTFRNIYTHTSLDDVSVDIAAGGAIYANGSLTRISIHDNTFTDAGWAVNLQCNTNACDTIDIYNNTFTNYDHGVVMGVATGGAMANVNIYGNHFGDTVNWDTTANRYHHDGIHIYQTSGGTGTGFSIYNNLFDGDWGDRHTTAQIYVEFNALNARVFNNVFLNTYGRYLTNGHLVLTGLTQGSEVYNNTIIGSGYTQAAACFVLSGGAGTGLTVKNNVVSNCRALVEFKANIVFASGGLDYNIYRTGNDMAFRNNTTFYNSTGFANWQVATGEGANSSYADTAAGLGSTGALLAGSAAIGTGANLTSLGIAALNSDAAGVGRPLIGAWDTGAKQRVEGPVQPTGLAATVN